MSGFIDLHTHSTASDSLYTPEELVRYAREKNLKALALTDHDTLAGLDRAMEEGRRLGVEVIPGIEISTLVEGCDVHIVGLLFDPHDPALTAHQKDMARTRIQRNRQVVEKLSAAGMDISMEDMKRFSDRQVSKAHIAMVLIQRGYAADLKDALKRLMGPGSVGYVRRQTPSPREAIAMIHEAGGLAFVAHINQIDGKDPAHSIDVCRQMLKAGADGLETRYCEYDDFWRETAEGLAREYGVLRSGGSDFHGAIKPNLDLGTGYGDLQVPYEFLEAMKAELKRGKYS